MSSLHDLILHSPLGDGAFEPLLFGLFSLHLLFVLLMLGTAMIAVFFFIHGWSGRHRDEFRWDRRVLRVHLVFKSVAVVLGVGPLLVIQTMWPVPFLTAVALLAPYWLTLTTLMIVAFLALDTLGHKNEVHPYIHLLVGVVGLLALIAIPLVFTGVLTVLEQPDRLVAFSLTRSLASHWLVRYLHILGAAALCGGVYHYFFSTTEDQARRYHLRHWIVAATLFQVLVGVLLLLTVSERLTTTVMVEVMVGVTAALLLVGVLFFRSPERGRGGAASILVLLPVLLVAMLLARQDLQHAAVGPFQATLAANALPHAEKLQPYLEAARTDYATHLARVYDNGPTIYDNACAFCHGADGSGAGPEAEWLIIPPERIRSVRADRSALLAILQEGVPGSGMPYFRVYDGRKLNALLDHLQERFAILDAPSTSTQGDLETAQTTWKEVCARCHGEQGEVTAFGGTLRPAPPSFRGYGLTPERAFEVITNGYDGTVMQPFGQLPEKTRWGLARLVASFRS